MINTGNRAYGLEIFFNEEGKPVYHFCELNEQKGEISIVQYREGVTDFSVIKPLLKSDFPLLAVVNGKGILGKITHDSISTNLREIFPGINANEFYFQTVTYKDKTWGFVARQRTLNELADGLLKDKLKLISLSFGLKSIAENFDSIVSQLSTTAIKIHGFVFGETPKDSLLRNSEIKIGDQSLAVKLFPAYCIALGYYTGKDTGIEYSRLQEAQSDFLNHKKLVKYSMVFTLVILGLILLSTITNLIYSNALAELKSTTGAYSSSADRDSLITQITQKKKFLLAGNWLGASKASFYSDRLAATIPDGIKLTGLELFPEKRINGSNDALEFDPSTFIVKGYSLDELVLKNWTEELKTKKWVSSIALSKYEWNNEKKHGEFIVNIMRN